MEPMGAMSEGEWNTFSGMFSPEEADFMAQLLSNCSLPNELSPPGHGSTMNLAGIQEGDSINPNMYSFLQESSYSGGNSLIFSTSSHESYYLQQQSDSHQFLSMNNSSMSSDFCMGEDQNTSLPVEVFMTNNPMEGDDCLKQEMSNGSMEEAGGNSPEAFLHGKNLQIGRKPEMPVPETSAEDKNNSPPENSKKRNRVSGEVQRKRNVKPKKNQKLDSTSNIDEKSKTGLHRQTSSSDCSEEDESNASPELNGGVTSSSRSKGAATLSLNGKTRASRGSATNPQSLYARKRRERINERLRILQNLVPNGTKVDISSMLEEAVQYVKFLQLQIKLLSSDDLWMYAPIAYNGMDIGLDLKIAMHR